jgi:hypothetical protein
MKQEDLSQDNETLMWAKYLSESGNQSLRSLGNTLKLWMLDFREISDLEETETLGVSYSDWYSAVPLVKCLSQSSNPKLQEIAEHFFRVLDSIILGMTDMRNNWPSAMSYPYIELLRNEKGYSDEPPF